MKNIAVITGASSGMGKEFLLTLKEYGSFDEVWAIARRKDRLEELSTSCPVRPVALDLTDASSFRAYEDLLKEEKPRVGLLINASGFGKFEAVMDTPLADNLGMIDLNCKAVAAMCQLTIPYMTPGSHIINIASASAFQPVPYIDIYGATKAFILSYSRALNRELKDIHVMALCPFWVKTDFFDRAVGENPVVKKYIVMYKPEDIVEKAWKDLKKQKDVSIYGLVAKGQIFLVKHLPHGFVMKTWMKQQGMQAK
ncbi:MAG: SDR family NAD(P)-dependent oxidoreductase [Clostridia bacterium]|nr:SDR family NAD(P)-dependent oxidoreductase [Clostridia bacterium]